jgi:hypothetical protein
MGSADELIRSCGRVLQKEQVRVILDEMVSLIVNPKMTKLARNLLCLGHLEQNGAEFAFAVLEGDPFYYRIGRSVPGRDNIMAFSELLENIDPNDQNSINKIRAIYWHHFAGSRGQVEADQAIDEICPKLADIIKS